MKGGTKSSTTRRAHVRRTGGNQTQAGKLLGLNRDQVRYRMEKFGLEKTPASAS